MYIRTKDGRIVDTTKYPEHPASWGVQASDYALTIKEADTIEELCDEFVIEYADGSKIISIHDNTDDFLREHKDEIESGYIKNVYASIWTDKGLIYVAKMNDKGELELI